MAAEHIQPPTLVNSSPGTSGSIDRGAGPRRMYCVYFFGEVTDPADAFSVVVQESDTPGSGGSWSDIDETILADVESGEFVRVKYFTRTKRYLRLRFYGGSGLTTIFTISLIVGDAQ